jgi:hypothetical protein
MPPSASQRRINRLTLEQCEEWIDNNGRVNPVTGARINPNSVSENSLNAMITNKCLEHGITRNGNPYIPLVNRQTNVQTNTQTNARTSSNSPNSLNSQSQQRSQQSSTMRRQSNTIYKKKNGDININDKTSFKYSELQKWWEDGVMAKNDQIHYKNPKTNKDVKENSPIYNRLLQQADAVCLIPINIDSLYDDGFISQESFEILNLLREEIATNNWTIKDMKREHDWEKKDHHERTKLDLKFMKYIFRFNPKQRNQRYFIKDILVDIDSINKKSVSSKSVENTNNINIACFKSVTDINIQYKGFRNKMIRICDQYTKQITMMTDTEIQTMLKTYFQYQQYYETQPIKIITGYPSILSLFQTFHFSGKHPDFLNVPKNRIQIKNYILNNDGTLTLDSGQDMGGLTNQTMSDAAQFLFDYKVFIKQNEDSMKYTFNPKFKFEKEHLDFLKKMSDGSQALMNDIENGQIYHMFYEFIGRLLCFFLQNSFKLPHHLSSYILNIFKFKTNKIKNHEHVLYAMNDFTDVSQSILNLMKEEPSSIKDLDMEYNDLYKIQFDKESGDLITSENIEQYFIDFAKHVNSNNNLRVDQGGVDDSSFIYKNFSQGIDNEFRKVFQYRNISHSIIDKMMTTEEITTELLHNLYNNIYDAIVVEFIEEDDEMNYLHNYRMYMKNILFNKRHDGDNLFSSHDNHISFVKKLLQFWTGLNYFKPEISYTIKIYDRGNTDRLPESHTCFNRIDIPKYQDEKTFWNKLKVAVEASFNTFQFAGGAKKVKKSRKTYKKDVK